MNDDKPLLDIQDVYAGYQKLDILQGVNIHVKSGEIVCVIGPNGAGKSTVFKAVYEHEQKVTGLINNLVNLAIEEKDHATNTFLQWFVNEQVEEESSADDMVQQLKMMENAPGGMFMLDRELAQRVFTPPAAEGA